MSTNHLGGNMQNEILREEHDGILNAKRVSLVSAATIYAVVDIASGETIGINSNVTLNPSPNYIGLTTATLGTGTKYVGLTTTTLGVGTSNIGLVTLNPSSAYIGLASVQVGVGAATIGIVRQAGPVTIAASPNYIGLVSVSHAAWADPKTYIGLTTSTIGNNTLFAVVNTGVATDPKAYIGLVTATLGVGTSNIGLVTANLAAVDTKSFLGLTTVVQGGGGTKYIGLTTTTLGVGTSNIGLVTLNASAAWTGLNTVVNGAGTQFIGLVTAHSGNEYASSTIFQGMASGASGVVRQLGANTATWCLVKADAGNATTVFIGPSLASVNVSYPLEPGEAMGLSVNNTNLLYLCATGTFSTIRFTGGN